MLPLVVAQIITPAPSPTPVVCAHPNVPATTVRSAEPVLPASAEGLGLQGSVHVAVTLDAGGAITAARIVSSPSGILNEAALAATRASTFQPEIRGCRPVPGEYIQSVDFFSRITPLSSAADRRIISVAGSGTVLRTPDAASVQVRLAATDESATRAAAQTEAQFQALLVKARALGISEAQVHTLYSVPRSLVVDTDAGLARSGFASSRVVGVTVDSPANAAKVAAALSAASFEVVGIRFALTSSRTAYEDALRAAIDDAETRARVVASAYHMRVGARRNIQLLSRDDWATAELAVFVRYPRPASAGTAAEPVAIPRIPVGASATIVFELET